MEITLKGIREYKRLSLYEASKLFGIDLKSLKDYEEYREIPSSQTVSIILNKTGIDNDNIFFTLFCDIISKYKAR